jgi:AcrR family transcriptional regulator
VKGLEDPQRRILDVAGQVFAEKGFKAATVREICQRAGVNLAAVNYYFRDKERLYIEAVKHAACGSDEDPKLPAWEPGTPPAVKIRDFIHMMVDKLMNKDRPAWHTQLVMRELAQPTSACAEWVQEYVRPKIGILQGIVDELLPGLPAWKRFMVGCSILAQCLFYLQDKAVVELLTAGEEAGRYGPRAVAEHVTSFSLAALGLAPPVGAANGRVPAGAEGRA